MKKQISSVARAMAALAVAFPASAQFYQQTNLVSDIPGMAQIQDAHLVNPWGVSHSPTSPFWVSDQVTSVSTVYSVNPTTGAVTQVALVVNVPVPSGQVHNGVTTDFLLSGKSASFIFASLNGSIYGWTGGGSATLAAAGPTPAAYTGIALGTLADVQHLYAANPAGNRIDVYDNTFANVNASFAGKWVDPSLPSGIVPFNVVDIDGDLYVSYAPMSPTVVGLGVIDEFDASGTFIRRFATGNATTVPLYDPWGMVLAPADFGAFSNDLLVGDFNLGNGAASPPAGGPGYILAFDPATGDYLGMLKGVDSAPLKIDGLWQLIFGNGGSGGNSSKLYFAAGIQNQAHGLFGSLTTCGGPVIAGASAAPNVLWPPNNKFVPVAIGYSVSDNCDAEPVCSLSVTAADSRGGINNTADSSAVVDAHNVELLASRNGGGDGRVYSVEISCKDKLPLSSSAVVTVTVPHDQGH
jgi:uncharacterized protein (TIGR03118 family)